ncbi:hypothetical protein [Mucilaginibacter pocheonensis]|uniref:Uncharacterized protein n=1 Tax=Mucilaginibacter pocheonensis TaxID=398050 RepID=A0ABU1TJ22_9SPHI|nr:hypothetical protein [Mucilaginibacter pocheonensis]MDR6945396.1 hypothetical protein [Mucilaginibacter pocheonensis]
MQRKLIVIAGLLFGSLYSGIVKAQQTNLAPDQNPRYLESQYKYARSADSLNSLHGTTIQNTYKAYDWYEARLERRRQNREWRHQERMNGSYYDYTPWWGLYGGYSYYPYSNFGYSFGNHYGRRGGRTSFGIGLGW